MNKLWQKLTKQSILIGLLFIWAGLLLGCSLNTNQGAMPVEIEVDHGTRRLETNAATVRDLLAEAEITLGDLDRVNPDLNRSVTRGMTVRVIRVTEEEITETNTIPFEQRIVTNEALPPGQQRLAQLGENGEEEIVTRITYEDGIEVDRVQLSRTETKAPVEEILVVGVEKETTSTLLDGVVAYLSGGNGWIIRSNSAARRPVTTEGDLDGRVFDLSPDGSRLLYTRLVTDVVGAPLNELWQVDTRIVGEKPISLPVQGLLYAEWSPRLTETIIAYSTAERVPSQPGWRANNDLWLWDINKSIATAVEIVPANTNGLYPWWGTTFAWSPDGTRFAFANANQVGVIDILSRTVTTLVDFPPFETDSNWVWTPTIAWSPNSKFLATVIHGPPLQNESQEASPVFDLWLVAAEGSLQIKVADQVGMWSNPTWHETGIAFGRAINPLSSVDSRYKLATMDWDGSNAQTRFPLGEEPGVELPEIAWTQGADSESFLFVNQSNLFLYQPSNPEPRQLTTDGQSHRPEWVFPQFEISSLINQNRITNTITSTTISTPTIITPTTR